MSMPRSPLRRPRSSAPACILWCAFALSVPTALSGCASDGDPEDRALELFEEALAAGRGGDMDEAVRLAREAAEARPGFVDPWMLVGNIEDRRERPEVAREAYREALACDPTFTPAGVCVALTYVREERFDDAREWLQRAVDADPGSAPALFNLGTLCARGGQMAEAGDWFRLAAAVNPRDPDSAMNVARAMAEQGLRDQALAWLDEAVARAGDLPGAPRLRAQADELRASLDAPHDRRQ